MVWYCLGNELILMLVLGMLLLVGLRSEKEEVLGLVGLLLLIGSLLVMSRLGLGSSLFNMGLGLLLIGGGLLCISGGFRERGLEYSLLVILYVIGTLVFIGWGDMVGLYVGLEIQSLSGYLLMGWRRDVYGVESSVKYLIVGSIGSGLVLLGILLVYLGGGTLDLVEIWLLSRFGDSLVSLGLFVVMVGLLVKLGSGGLHQWWIDVLEGGDVRSSGLVSVVGKISLMIVLIRLLLVLEDLNLVLVYSGVISLLVSVVGCYYQRRIKRFMGYSSLGFLGLGSDVSSLMNYLFVYGGMSVGLWCVVEVLNVNYLDEVRLVVGNNGYLSGGLGLLFLSMVGLPPLYGFIAKFNLLLILVKNGGLVLCLLMIILGIVSGFNYVRWLKVVYYEEVVLCEVERRLVIVGLLDSLKIGLVVLLLFFGLVLF